MQRRAHDLTAIALTGAARGTPYAEAAELFEDYARHPSRYWKPGPHRPQHRQARKLRMAVDRGSAVAGDENALLISVVSLALARTENRPPPVYVMGLGGSGSHWLAAMVADLLGAVNVGEVYVPSRLLDAMKELDSRQQGLVVDCIHLLHAPTTFFSDADDALVDARVVNAPFGVLRRRHKAWDPDSCVIHLLRDPRDQVLSVSFRKDEYRRHIHPGMSDGEYLVDRAEVTARNHAEWKRSPLSADITCRYEDLRASAAGVLRSLVDHIGAQVEARDITRVAHAHDAALMRAGAIPAQGNLSAKSGGGWRHETSERQRAVLHATLADAIVQTGYPMDDCLGCPVPMTASEEARRLCFPRASGLGDLFVRGSRADSRWVLLGEARSEVRVPAGCVVRLRVSERAERDAIMALAGMPNARLESLCLAGNAAVDDEVGVMVRSVQELQELDLARTAVTETTALDLSAVRRLRGLSLVGTAVSQETVRSLQVALPSCAVVA